MLSQVIARQNHRRIAQIVRREPHHLDVEPWREFACLPGTGTKSTRQSLLPGNKHHARILRETTINRRRLLAERLTLKQEMNNS